MSMLGQVLSLRRQVAQAKTDAAQMLQDARAKRDQRRVDHYSGKTLALITILDMMIDKEFGLTKRRIRLARSARPRVAGLCAGRRVVHGSQEFAITSAPVAGTAKPMTRRMRVLDRAGVPPPTGFTYGWSASWQTSRSRTVVTYPRGRYACHGAGHVLDPARARPRRPSARSPQVRVFPAIPVRCLVHSPGQRDVPGPCRLGIGHSDSK